MPKFLILAREVVFYEKIVDAPNEQFIRDSIFDGTLQLDDSDIIDGEDFEISSIEELNLEQSEDSDDEES